MNRYANNNAPKNIDNTDPNSIIMWARSVGKQVKNDWEFAGALAEAKDQQLTAARAERLAKMKYPS